MKRLFAALALCLTFTFTTSKAADIRQGLVSYLPLESLAPDFSTTPDLAGGNHFITGNFFDASAIVAGKRGNAFQFDGDISQRYLHFVTPDGVDTGLPIKRARIYSILMWVKGKGTGQSDRNIFSESSSIATDPLLDFGSHSTGANDTLDFFVRNSGTQINHQRTTVTPLDDQWHHIAWTDNNGQIRVYIDGQSAYTATIAHGPTPMDTTSIAATVRLSNGTPVQYYFNGLLDEISLWERVLTQEEVNEVMANGIATPIPRFVPFINVQPAGATDLLVGDTYSMSVLAGGSRPLAFQWKKNGTPINGATSSTLSLAAVAKTDSGEYTVDISNSEGTAISAAASIQVNDVPPPDLKQGMVSYWPLDEVTGTKTPDVARGYDMVLVNLTEAELVPGKWGKAFRFNGTSAALERVHLPEDELPIYTKHRNLTVSVWVNGPSFQQDKRIFSESSTTVNTPLFNLGTHQTAVNGAVDIYIRNDANQQGGHRFSVTEAYDDTWHHVVYAHREVGGVMQAALYIDGVKDDVVLDPRRPLTGNVTSIGVVRRGSDAAPNRTFYFNGMIDDVAVWKRALSEEEIRLLFTTGTPRPGVIVQPLAIRKFQADLAAVASGDPVTLRWDVSSDATKVAIDQGVGDVTSKTITGLGSTSVAVDQTKTFRLTVTRGNESLTATVSVAAVSGIASNWALLDNFETYAEGRFPSVTWADLGGNSMIVTVDGSKMLDLRGTGRIALLSLNDLKVTEGQTRTLFTRFYVQGNPADAVRNLVGLTDRSLRFVTDATDAGGAGPSARVSNEQTDLMVGVRNGVGALVELAPPVLEVGALYNLWIDVNNQPIETGDIYSIWLQKQGDPDRTRLFMDYVGDRDPNGDPASAGGSPTRPDLDKVFVGNDAVNSVFFDDFYISKSGLNSTVPKPVKMDPPTLSLSRTASQIQITFAGGVLESAPSVTATFEPVQGATPPTYTVTPDQAQRFYRVKQ